jgi:hypothetical protein
MSASTTIECGDCGGCGRVTGETTSRYVWHSDNANAAYEGLREDDVVRLEAYAYGDRLRRVTVTKGEKIFGMKRQRHRPCYKK